MNSNHTASATGGDAGPKAEADRLCQEGYALLEERHFDVAMAKLVRARELDPDNAQVHYRLGLLYSDTDRPLDALACFDASIKLNGDDARPHNNRGSALQLLGRTADAEIAFRRAMAIIPDADIPYLNLGYLLEQAGRPDEAVAVYNAAIARGINVPLFQHNLAAMAGQVTDRAPDNWVVATFDNFAPTFDAHLHKLNYNAPELLAQRLRQVGSGPWDILDLGCGTGQCGAALAAHRRHMVGIDLSSRMLAQAKALGVYDDLANTEIHAWLREASPASFDVVSSADVFIYIGDLGQVFEGVARVLRPGGWFAFTTEECSDVPFQLLATGRYAQSLAYIRALAEPSFQVETAEAVTIRFDAGKPLPSRLYLLCRR